MPEDMNNQMPQEAGSAMQPPVESGAAMQTGDQWTPDAAAQGATATMPEVGSDQPSQDGAMPGASNDSYGLEAKTTFTEDQINDPNSKGTIELTDTTAPAAEGNMESSGDTTATSETSDATAPAAEGGLGSMSSPAEAGMGDMSNNATAPIAEASPESTSEASTSIDSTVVSPDVVPFAGSEAASPAAEGNMESNGDTTATSDEVKPDAEKWTGSSDDNAEADNSNEVSAATILESIEKASSNLSNEDRMNIAKQLFK